MPTTDAATKHRVDAPPGAPEHDERSAGDDDRPDDPPSQLRTRATHSSQEGTVSATQRATLSSNETTCPPSTKPARAERRRAGRRTAAPPRRMSRTCSQRRVSGVASSRPKVQRSAGAATDARHRTARASRPVAALELLARAAPARVVATDVGVSSLTTCFGAGGRAALAPARGRQRRRSRRRQRTSRARSESACGASPGCSACSASSSCTSTWNSVTTTSSRISGSAPRT